MKTDDGAGARNVECVSCSYVQNKMHTKCLNCGSRKLVPVAERGEVGSVGQGEPGKCPACGAPLKYCAQGEYCSDDKCRYVDGIMPTKEAQPEAGAVTPANVCSDCAAESDPCAKVLGTGKCRCLCHVAKRASVAPSVEPLNRMLGEALGHVKTMQATLEQVFDLCDEWLQAPSLSKSSSLGILQRVCEIIHNETGRKSVRESESIEFKAVAPSVEESRPSAEEVQELATVFLQMQDEGSLYPKLETKRLAAFYQWMQERITR